MKRMIRTAAERFSDCSLRIRILMIILANSIVILACTFLGYFLYTHTYNQLLYRAMASNLASASGEIEEELEGVEKLSSMIIASANVQDALTILQQEVDGIEQSECSRTLNNALQEYSSYTDSPVISYLALFNPQFTSTTNWVLLRKTPEEQMEEAKTAGMEQEGGVAWTWSWRGSCILLSRDVRQIENLSLKSLGELVISVDLEQVIQESTRAISMYQEQSFILADENDCIIYASSALTDEDAVWFLSRSDSAFQRLTWQGHDYFMVCGSLPEYGYRYISLAPFEEITNALHRSTGLIFLVFLLGFFLIIFLTNRLILGITRQFDALNRKMEDFTQSELKLPERGNRYSAGNSEIGTLHRHFDQMAARIRHLVQVNYVNDILKKDAQLEALKAQINPHFLYNTLETINWRAKACGDVQTSQIVEALGTVLRGSLSAKKPLVTLAYETELANSYMTIQKIRFEDRLEYEVIADPAAMDGLIPPLTVQPLMENAIHYGMEEMLEVCHIRLRIVLAEDLLTVSVENDGSVFEEQLLEKLKNRTVDSHGFGIGLLNIEQRIRLLFGEEYGLSLSNENGFAVAAIRIPYRKEE